MDVLTQCLFYYWTENMTKTKTTIVFTSRATMITIKCSQLSDRRFTILFEMNLIDGTTQTTIKNDVSHVTGRCCVKNHWCPRSPDFEELCLGIFEVLFCKCTSRATRPYHRKTTTVDIKIMYTKTNANKIHEMQGVKFLQNKHCSVYETEQRITYLSTASGTHD